MSLWLLLADKAKGYALELHPAPTQWNRPPRPFSPGAEGENFTDFALHWLSDTPSNNAQSWGNRWREPLDKNDPLQRSAFESGALAYRLLYHSVDNPLRQQCTVRFQLDEAELQAQGGGRGISGESGDLLFALAVVTVAQPRAGGYLPLAATGVLDESGRVKYVTGVADKLKAYLTAIANLPETKPVKTDDNDEQAKALFFHPRANNDDLSLELRKTAHQAGVRLITVESLEEALCALGITVKDYWEGNPYQGFGFFDTVHRRIFFGRETESAIVCEALLQREKDGTPGILVIGSSGRGKSSLVRAGVIPRLQQHEALLDRPIFFHSWRLPDNKENNDHIVSEALLTNALRQAWAHRPELQYMEATQEGATNTNTLSALADELAQVLPQTQRFVWVIDQMEELFTNYPIATIEAFGAFLKRLQTLGVWPIATLRSEYAHDYQNTNLLEVFGNGYILPKMHETALELAIRKPATLAKLDFETDPVTGINLAAHIRDEALQGGEDMLPLLGFVLSKLYEDPERIKQNDGWLRWEAYRRLGGLQDASKQNLEQPSEEKPNQPTSRFSKLLARFGLRRKEPPAPHPPLMSNRAPHIGCLAGAVSRHANELLSACTIEERNTLHKVLLHLVRLSEDGNQVLRQRARLNAFAAESQQASLVRKLIDGRLLISNVDADTQEPTVELVHDCLLTAWDKVGVAIEQHRELLEESRKLRNAATHWERNGRPELLLMSKAVEVLRAEVLVACIGAENIDSTVLDFLRESIRYTRAGFRMFWLLLCILGISLEVWVLQELLQDDDGTVLFITTLLLIVFFPVFIRAVRSIVIKPYLATAKTDMKLGYSYLFFITIPAYIIFNFSFLKSGTTLSDILGYAATIILPVIFTYRRVRSNTIAIRSLRYKNINILKNKTGFLWCSNLLSILSWRKLEILIWIVVFSIFYSQWNDWKRGNMIFEKLKANAMVELVETLHEKVEKKIQKKEINGSNKNLTDARNIIFNSDAIKFDSFRWNFTYRLDEKQNYQNNALKVSLLSFENLYLYLKARNINDISDHRYIILDHNNFSSWLSARFTDFTKWRQIIAMSNLIEGLLFPLLGESELFYLDFVNPGYQADDLVNAKERFDRLIADDKESSWLHKYGLKSKNKILYLRCQYVLLKKLSYIAHEAGKHQLADSRLSEAKQTLDTLYDISCPSVNCHIKNEVNGLLESYEGVDFIEKNNDGSTPIDTINAVAILINEFLKNQDFYVRKPKQQNLAKILGILAYESIIDKKYDVALSYTKRALTLSPDDMWVKIQMAHALMLLNRYTEAEVFYSQAYATPITMIDHKDLKNEVLEDFEEFRSLGIDNKYMTTIEKKYKSKQGAS